MTVTNQAELEGLQAIGRIVATTLQAMARAMEPTNQGSPLEIYAFTDTTAWLEYEAIQGDIFDHLIAILPEFGLRVFQVPSGNDMQVALRQHEVQALQR